MDYTKLSDSTLELLASGKALDYTKLSPQELQELAAPKTESQGLLSTIDSYTGAPGRAGAYALEQGKGLLGALSAAKDQFGEDPSKAPTGQQVYENAPMAIRQGLLRGFHLPGTENVINKSGMGGIIADNATNPLSALAATDAIPNAITSAVKAAPALAEGANTIAQTLNPKRNIVIKGVIDALSEAKDALNPKTQSTAIDEISSLIDFTKKVNKYGKINAEDANRLSSLFNSVIDGEKAGAYTRQAAGMASNALDEVLGNKSQIARKIVSTPATEAAPVSASKTISKSANPKSISTKDIFSGRAKK